MRCSTRGNGLLSWSGRGDAVVRWYKPRMKQVGPLSSSALSKRLHHLTMDGASHVELTSTRSGQAHYLKEAPTIYLQTSITTKNCTRHHNLMFIVSTVGSRPKFIFCFSCDEHLYERGNAGSGETNDELRGIAVTHTYIN